MRALTHLKIRIFYTLLLCSGPAVCADPWIDLPGQIDQVRSKYGVAGVAVVLVDRERTLLQYYSGVTDWQSNRQVTASTWFRAGSVTKVFTGLALLAAEAEGLVTIDAPVTAQLKGIPTPFTNPWAATHPIFLADLMEHTAGWFDMSGLEFSSKDPTPLSLGQALLLQPSSRLSHWPPATHSVYSNSGPGVAAWVLEQQLKRAARPGPESADDHTIESFDRYIQSRVFEPLGMSASLLLTPQIEADLASGYDSDKTTIIPYWHIVYRPSGGINVRPAEMSRFLRMMLNHGNLDGHQLFTHEQLNRLEKPTRSLAAQQGLEFGYGLGVYRSIHQGHVLYGHGGDGDGYLAQFAYSKDSGRGYFVVINAFSSPPLDELKELLADALIAGQTKPQPEPVFKHSSKELQALTGTYNLAATRFPRQGWQDRKLRVTLTESGLRLARDGRSGYRIVATSKTEFRRPFEPVATRAFIQREDGSMVYQDSSGNWVRPAPP